MKKLFYSLVASCLLLTIASPAKAELVLIRHDIIDQGDGDLDGLGFRCLYYQYQDTYLEDTSGQVSTVTYWLNSGICDWTSNLQPITPTDFGL
jgi:hypothetical protein